MKKVYVPVRNGVVLGVFTSLKGACDELGVGYTHVSRNLVDGAYVRDDYGVYEKEIVKIRGRSGNSENFFGKRQ